MNYQATAIRSTDHITCIGKQEKFLSGPTPTPQQFPRGSDPYFGGHGGRVVTLSPPTSAAGVQSPSWP